MNQQLLLYGIGLALSLYMAYNLGANDAANPTACTVGAGVLTVKKAVLLFSIFVAIGALLQGHLVSETIGRGILPGEEGISILGAFTSILAVGIWVTFASWQGLPISTTHSIVGAVIGFSIFARGGFNPQVLLLVLIAMVISPLIAIGFSMGLLPVVRRMMSKISEKIGPERATTLLNAMVVFSLCFSAYSFGANDIANAMGPFTVAVEELGVAPTGVTRPLLALLGSAAIAVGGFSLGSRVIETAGRHITNLKPITAFTAEFSNALIVILFTTLPSVLLGMGGAPVSTTHVSIGTIIGVGLAGRGVGVNRKTILKIVGSWVITLPAALAISVALYFGVSAVL